MHQETRPELLHQAEILDRVIVPQLYLKSSMSRLTKLRQIILAG